MYTSYREEKWYCVSPAEKTRLRNKYPDWPEDHFANQIPFRDVGMFPPNGGTPEYLRAKEGLGSLESWYEYHTDFLPEELVYSLNSGRGGFVSQRRIVTLPRAAPRTNEKCIERLCDLLTTSCPQTAELLQRDIDRIVVGCSIRSYTHTHTYTRKQFGSDWYIGKVTKRNLEGLATDARCHYQVVYEDDDAEELYVEEIVPLMQVREGMGAGDTLPHTPNHTHPTGSWYKKIP